MNPNETKTPNLVGTTPTTRVQGGSIVPITDTATGKAITSDILGSNTPVPVPTIPTSTVAQGLSGAIDGVKTSAQATLDQQNKLNLENAKAKESSSATDLKSIVEQQLGIATDRANLETEAKIAEKSQAVTNVTNQIEASQRAQTNELRALQEDKFLTPAQLAGRTQEINRKYAFEQADLALIQSAANRDYDTAQNIVDRKIQLQLEPLKLKYDYYKAINEGDKSAYTEAQKNTLKNLETKAATELKKAEDFQATKKAYGTEVLKKDNPNIELFKAINNATNDSELATAVINNSNHPTVNANTKPEIQKALTVILGSGKFTKEQKADVTSAITNGEDPFTVIKNKAKDIMGQTLATNLDKYEVAKKQIESIDTLLQDFYANKGETGFWKGGFEKAINKVGELTDPKLVEIGTNIASALQVYRNAVSGTAYSVQEGADIASIFPGINKSEGLNKAIMKGRLNAFDTAIDGQYENTLGGVYKTLKESTKDVRKLEADASSAVKAYVAKNPQNYQKLLSDVASLKTSLGREPEALDIVTYFPEYK